MAVLCPFCYRDSSDTCCSEAAADREAFAQQQRERRALLDRLGIESAQSPRHGGFSNAPTEWETRPNLDSLFAFLTRLDPSAP